MSKTTRIGLWSDLHLESRQPYEIDTLVEKIKAAEKDCDFFLNAGDLHPSSFHRLNFFSRLGLTKPCLSTMGNHDYYDNTPRLSVCQGRETFNNKNIVHATLWTDFNRGDLFVQVKYKHCLIDAKRIMKIPSKNPTRDLGDDVADLNRENFNFIKNNNPDIVMTHHCPSMQSVHPKFKKEPAFNFVNHYFASDYDYYIEKSNIKLWVHGHTHEPFDYMIGNCRVVCNPLGYPFERKVEDYDVKILEVD